ncbi:uncharacterized protein [Epargyreus clarus]|uniref:uncharacterized protein n=1 Tax=Epargyreus clarus TaxID=520877 RepID=UPI003C2DAECA
MLPMQLPALFYIKFTHPIKYSLSVQFLLKTVAFTMLPPLSVLFIVISVVSCQIDGEFWWLKNDMTKFRHGRVSPPKFDDVNELDTDETAKITFKDTDLSSNKEVHSNMNINGKSENIDEAASVIHFRDETELAKPLIEIENINFDTLNALLENLTKNIDHEKDNESHKDKDEFQFIFPSENNALWKVTENLNKETTTFPSQSKTDDLSKINNIDKISHNNIVSEDKDDLQPESICSFIEKSECIRNEGTLHTPRLKLEKHMNVPNQEIICCILPITKASISKIVFPDNDLLTKRFKRSSTDDVSAALKQRNTLMSRKYTLDNQRVRTTTPAIRRKATQKVVNSDEYSVDPYWNIKNSNIRNPDVPIYQDPDSAYDYGSHSFGDDYTVELPKPGLIGLYSDHRQTQTTWNHNKHKVFSYGPLDSVEEEFETPFGYGSSIDPRLDHRSTSKPNRRKPSKLTATLSKDPMHSSQSQTINFHSNPDFQIMQGFKLLNLMRQKNRVVRKTPANDEECDNNGVKIKEKPSKYTNYAVDDYDERLYETNLKLRLFNECGIPQVPIEDCENGHEQGIVQNGAHPWIVLVIATNSEQNLLCYGTLVHARVAVTAAECVDGKAPGAISIIAGVRNLDKAVEQSQRRMASVILHSEYTPGDLAHNLALLHWKRPLILDATVQPACLAEPHSGESCLFVGWGGYDQKMLSDLRWQRASVLSQNCNKRLSKLKVDALCAAVEATGTVTGLGGPLLCKRNGRWSAVGVAVWRDDVVILLPPQEWVIRNMATLRIQ